MSSPRENDCSIGFSFTATFLILISLERFISDDFMADKELALAVPTAFSVDFVDEFAAFLRVLELRVCQSSHDSAIEYQEMDSWDCLWDVFDLCKWVSVWD